MVDYSKLERIITSGEDFSVPSHLKSWLDRTQELYIGGKRVQGSSGKTFETLNPATGEVISRIAVAEKADIDQAVAAGRKAFESGVWSLLSLSERSRKLKELASKIQERRADLAILESLDTGKPIRESFDGDILRAGQNFSFFCDFATEEKTTYDNAEERHTVFREPLGVVALITPWNLPLYLETWKLAPALLMGNSVVLKPSELTPLTASYLADLVHELGFPPGVFNLVQGFGESAAGEFLVSHPDVNAISFTGETSTGRAIERCAAVGPTRVSFELGGKGTSIVFADAPWERLMEESIRGAFRNQGQICLAMPRILVEEKVFDRFVSEFIERAKKIQPGNPLNYSTVMGSLIGKEHLEKVDGYVRSVESPGKVLLGGKRISGNGAFYPPTVVTGIPATHRMSCEEVFGPVVSIHPFKSEEEALKVANGTQYGLSACVWSQSEETVRRVSRLLRHGLVWANCWFVRDLRVPFGGQKRSGIGREGGKYSLDFFSEWKSVCERKGHYDLA